ncbi:MAG TPA: proprotein convertase P-domain-containing protein [Thermoanaerobaculia bacterium]|nr:proprotein convertase P-domain-containing protein [Thermoanaerobaculia bacterium]
MLLALVLHLELIRHSLTGTHYRYQQYLDGVRVVGGEVNVTVGTDGRRTETRTLGEAPNAARNGAAPHIYVNVDGVATPATRVVVDHIVRYVDPDGEVIREEPLIAYGKPARVFDPNPVTKLNAPSLQNMNDSASAVPDEAYSDVMLERTNESGPLGGPFVQIVDVSLPAIPPVDAAGPLLFHRGEDGFEDVNAYFHIDKLQMYLQSLGYRDERAVAAYPVEVDTHAANGADDSFFLSSASAGRGSLFFGVGGTDDAEDSDLIAHEYAHVMHEWIAPGTFLGPLDTEGRAISEGFADYWAFSAKYEAALASGRDPFCFADWDARCGDDAPSERCGYPPGADCLRRVDSPKRRADFITGAGPGTEHRNGEIWSSALREIFVALAGRHGREAAKRLADTLVVESLFGAQPNPSFEGIARRMIAADRLLTGGASADVVCAAMTSRGILESCAVPLGEITLFQSPEQGIEIPDNSAAGITAARTISDTRDIERILVSVNIRHPARGDLRLVLVAPDGTETLLQNPSGDRGADVNTTYGRDSNPVDSLERLRGRSAAGVWRLRVIDLRVLDVGTLLSWSLAIQFAGDEPSATRPVRSESRRVIAAAASVPAWVTDLRLFSARDTTASLVFTPSGADGRTAFAAVNVQIPAGTTVAFDDVVRSLFGTSGIGQIEIGGDALATSRTYTRTGSGTFGQFIPAVPAAEAASSAFLPRLQNSAAFRSNLGFAEAAGERGVVRVRLYEGERGTLLSSTDYTIEPFGHVQVPAAGAETLVAELDVVEGPARLIAYASVIDNMSGDPMFLLATRAGPGPGIAPAISARGAAGTEWRSELWVTSGDSSLPFAPFQVRYDGAAAELRERSPRTVLERSPDAVADLFGRPGTRGAMSHDETRMFFTQRVYTTGPRGSFGQSVPFASPSSESRELLHIESSDDFRTNIGAVTDTESEVRFVVFDSAGRELSRSDHTLAAGGLVQFTVPGPVRNGRVRVDVLAGRVYPYASIVDNRSGDPAFVPGQ